MRCYGTMLTRRRFIQSSAALGLWPERGAWSAPAGEWVNDIHAGLSATRVRAIHAPASQDDLRAVIARARRERRPVCIAGGRHSMGSQPFVTDGDLIDMRGLKRVLAFERDRGIIDVEAGIQWPELLAYLTSSQQDSQRPWTFAQKQTGADRLTLGGCLSANAHGRGLTMKPFIGDVESFVLVDARGELRTCSRDQNAELFRLAIGGYGLFGPIYSVKLRLVPRTKVERIVEIIDVADAKRRFDERIRDGFEFGDFQYSTDAGSGTFLRNGVFSCYRPVAAETPMPAQHQELSDRNWRELLYLAHADKAAAYTRYSDYYRSTSGQLYWSDLHQMSIYPDGYHVEVDTAMAVKTRGSEMITEIYVPRDALAAFFADARRDFLTHKVNVIYGTVRLIERDDESFLAWAREPFACTIFNLHVDHAPEGMRLARAAFQRLIDLGIKYGGSYYLTYHKWATRRQVAKCYPQFPEFLRLKRKYDPEERFQSDWYRHYRLMFA